MRVPTFVIMLPKDAKKTSRLMGLWNALDEQKVTMMKRHPSSEKTEQVRSMMLSKSRSPFAKFSFSWGFSMVTVMSLGYG